MAEPAMTEMAARLLRRRGSVPSSTQSVETRRHGDARRMDSMSIVSHTEEPAGHDDLTRNATNVENTYHMAPPRVFPVLSTRLIAQEVLRSYLVNETYNPEICRGISKAVSEAIKSRVKELGVARFKLAVLVHIGGSGGGGEGAGTSAGAGTSGGGDGPRDAAKGQGAVRVVSRCLWDASTDTVVSASFTRAGLYAVANIYAVYYE